MILFPRYISEKHPISAYIIDRFTSNQNWPNQASEFKVIGVCEETFYSESTYLMFRSDM